MSSGSLKDVIKAINNTVPQSEFSVPDNLQEAIQAYLDKHTPIEVSDSRKLHDELMSIWQKQARDKPACYPCFLKILRKLRPAIRGEETWLQWWDALVVPVLGHMAQQKGLASQCRKLLLAIMIFEPEDKEAARMESARLTSIAIAGKIVEIWLKKSAIAQAEGHLTAKYMQDQIKVVLMEYGRKKPQELFNVVNKYFVQSKYRNQMTTLLVDVLGQDAPHLHVMRETPLFDNLLRCLQIDTSSTVIAQGMTALTMLLPHIPVSSGGYLPSLFNIYTRMLFWEKYKDPSALQHHGSDDGEDTLPMAKDAGSWEVLTYSGDASDESLPDILHYFTFLYGLYPMNLMDYIRKPSKWRWDWVKEERSLSGYEIEVEPHEIQYRSKAFSSQHLLHPHFLSHTNKSELTDAERWRQHAASDVATFCMELLQPLANDVTVPVTPIFSGSASQELSRAFELRRGERGLLSRSSSHETFHTHRSNEVPKEGITSNPTSGLSSRHMSAVVLPDGTGEFSQIARLPSRNSLSASSTQDMLSPGTLTDASRPDSSNGAGSTEAVASLEGMLASQHSARRNLRHSIKSDSFTALPSLDTSNPGNASADTFLATLPSLNRSQAPSSPSLRPTTSQGEQATIASLHRDVILLKNSLSFERYLKQQHFAHIGKLRRTGIREAVAEAETQNLINTNRKLKLDLEKEKEMVVKVRKEADLSRAQSRKWEADVTAKLRAIKEEQKKWLTEKDGLVTELETLKGDNEGMKQLIIQGEERESQKTRRLQSVDIELESLNRVQAERDKLKQRLRKFLQNEKGEEEKTAEKERQESKIGFLEMQLEVKERELEETRLQGTREIEELRAELETTAAHARKEATTKVQEMIDSALEASRKRFSDAQRLQDQLRSRIVTLEAENMSLKDAESRDRFKAMRADSFASGSASPPRQSRRLVHRNPLGSYSSQEPIGEHDGVADDRSMVAKSQSTTALPRQIPRYDSHNSSMAGGGGRVVPSATQRRSRDERRAPSTPTPSRTLGRGQSLGPPARSHDGESGSERGRDDIKRARSPKPKQGERTGLLFARGRSLYDSMRF